MSEEAWRISAMSSRLPSVQRLLLDRIKAGTAPTNRSDPYHLALVIEGGGMRGVVAGGMVTAIEKLGVLDAFDSIHASSAGACAGAYLLAEQAAYGTRIYYEDINNKEFINVARILYGGPIMDADYLIDNVMRKIKKLDANKTIKDGRLNIISTNIDTGEYYTFNKFKNIDDFFNKLKSSIYIPIIAGKYISIENKRFCDGGVVQHIAYKSAISNGATHILFLLTTRLDNLFRSRKKIKELIEGYIINKIYGKRMYDAYMKRNENINYAMQNIIMDDFRAISKSITTDFIIRGIDSPYISRLDKNTEKLIRGARDGENAVYDFFKRID